MKKERDERNQKTIDEKYSIQAERLNMGEFALTRVLNEDAELKVIWLLGRFRRDPTENRALLVMKKTEFDEKQIREFFPAIKKEGGKRGTQNMSTEQFFHNNEWRKYWFDLPREFSKVQCDVIYPASDKDINKYTR